MEDRMIRTVDELAERVRADMDALLDGTDEVLGNLPEDFPIEQVCDALFTDRPVTRKGRKVTALRKRAGSPWGIKRGVPRQVFEAASSVRAKTLFADGRRTNLEGLLWDNLIIPPDHAWFVATETMAYVLVVLAGRDPERGFRRWAEALGTDVKGAERFVRSQTLR